MGISFLAPLFLAGLLAISVPIVVHLIRRHQGKQLLFPSLMFLRQVPIRSIRRMKVRDWPLLILRALALALIVVAFSRPVFRLGEAEAGEGDGLRDVVIALDRSGSMTRGDRWERALDEARSVLSGLVNPDRVALVVFDGIGQVVVEPTLDPGRVRSALDTLSAGWNRTQIGAGLQAAAGLLQGSERSRREIVLISDFQRRGWDDGPRDRLPAGIALTTADVGDDGLGTLVVGDVALEHSFFEGRQRVTPNVRVVRQGEGAPTRARLVFEMDGREVESRTIEVPDEGATSFAFQPITLPDAGVRGAVRILPEGAPPEEPFRFFFSPQEVLNILLVERAGAGQNGLYLRNALSVTGGTPVRVTTRQGTGFTQAQLDEADVVVLNDLPLPDRQAGNLLRTYVRNGGGLVIAAGGSSSPTGWEAAWSEFLPGTIGNPVDRIPTRGVALAGVDRDHPIFAAFTATEAGGLGGPRFFRYRSLALPALPEAADSTAAARPDAPRVVARFEDGTPALAERSVGAGRVVVWTSSLDPTWSDFPLHAVFVPIVREMARYASSRSEVVPYFAVGQPLDAAFLLGDEAAAAPEGAASAPEGELGSVAGILVGPGGIGIELRAGGGQLVQLAVPGFYDVRMGSESGPIGRTLAANPELREADPARLEPADLVAAVAPIPGGGTGVEGGTGQNLLTDGEAGVSLAQEAERRQGAWRFLLLAAALLLLGETYLAARAKPLAKLAEEA